jgi:hypothetical protein
MPQFISAKGIDAPRISQLFIYPIKSCAGISVSSLQFDEKGPILDRRWMLVDAQSGVFLTQRQLPRMALISTHINGAEVSARQAMDCELPESCILPIVGKRVDVSIWSDDVSGFDCGDEAADWFSALLRHECRLIYQGECERHADKKYAASGTEISYADGFPLLVVNQASIKLLNDDCAGGEITAANFRPNIVVVNAEAFSEKTWGDLSTENVSMKVVKPCERCVITTINPNTAVSDKNILSVLAKYCRDNNKIYFGQNLTFEYLDGITLTVGESLTIGVNETLLIK